MSNEKTSFWSFLKNHEIKVPVIQRDYVQGREGEDEGNIRANFLEAIKKALDGEVLSLDFVYGTDENEVLEPLDGQQRLTTLWLLHWYIACKAGVLDDSVKNTLSRLTYDERQPAEEFCKQLCKFDFNTEDQGGIVECLESKCADWFKDSEYKDKWQNDPTIKAMLYMLGGKKDNKKNKNKDIIADNIEKLFEGTDKEKYLNYWKKLTFENANEVLIVFYYLPLKQFGLSDDLYIKMNARGLLLTDYEYLKADLIKYMKEQKENADEKEKDEWKKLLDEDSGIPKKMDDDWTNIFLHKCSDDEEIDGIYFAFLNRFFWNELFIKEPNNQKEIKSFDEKGNKKYSNFKSYEYLLNKDPLGFFQNLQNVLDRYLEYTESNDAPCAKWFEDFGLIPNSDMEYDTKPKRAIFFALCKYFKDGKADKTSLDRWMRVVCNLVSGITEDDGWQIDEDKNGYSKIVDYIDKLDSHNVYKSLDEKELDEENDSPFTFEGKCNEEIIKTKKILKDNTGEWENRIQKAENYAFFYGAIRFLFQNEEGKEDWKCFKDKCKNVKEYFNKEAEEKDCCLNNNNADLLKMLISWFNDDNYNKILCRYEKTGIFNNRTATWRYYLSNREICLPVHHLLLGEKNNKLDSSFSDYKKKNVVRLLSKTKLLDSTIKEEPDLCLRDWNNCKALYKYRSHSNKFVLLDSWLDHFILHIEKRRITTNNSMMIKGTDLHYGYNEVYFDYRRKHWLLWEDNRIYLQKNKDPNSDSDASVRRPNKNPKTLEEEYYCLNVNQYANNRDNKEKEIFDGLDNLIGEYKKDMEK